MKKWQISLHLKIVVIERAFKGDSHFPEKPIRRPNRQAPLWLDQSSPLSILAAHWSTNQSALPLHALALYTFSTHTHFLVGKIENFRKNRETGRDSRKNVFYIGIKRKSKEIRNKIQMEIWAYPKPVKSTKKKTGKILVLYFLIESRLSFFIFTR